MDNLFNICYKCWRLSILKDVSILGIDQTHNIWLSNHSPLLFVNVLFLCKYK